MDSHIGGGGEFAQIPYFPPYGDADDDDNVDYDKQLIHLDAWGAEKVLHIGHRHADLLMMMMCRNQALAGSRESRDPGICSQPKSRDFQN